MRDPREKGKSKPNWSGPFLIKEIFSSGGVRLVDLDGNLFAEPTNMDQLKRYHVLKKIKIEMVG